MGNMHVAIYVRISQDAGEKEDVLADHRNQLLRLAEKYKYSYDVYEEVMSGEKLANRLQMQKLLNNIEKYTGLLVMDLDRLSRDDYEGSQIKQILYMNDIAIITPMKEYNLDNDSDETLFSFQSLIAKMELKQIRKRFKRGKQEGARQGRWTNGVPPLGYGLNGTTRILEVIEEEAIIIREMKDLALKGYPAEAIARMLNTKGYRTRTGQRFTGSQTRATLMRKTYRGYITLKNKDKRGRLEEEIISPKAHDALISEEEYLRIRKFFDDRRTYATKSKVNGRSIVQGLVFCKCGAKLGFQSHHDKKNPYVKLRACHNWNPITSIRCDCSGIKAEIIEEAVIQELKKVLKDCKNYLTQHIERNPELQLERIKQDMTALCKKMDKSRTMTNKLLKLYLQDKLSEEEYIAERENLKKERAHCKNELRLLEIERDTLELKAQSSRLEEIIHLISHLEKLNTSELNIFLKTIIKRITYWRVIPQHVDLKGIPIKERFLELIKQYPPLIQIEYYEDEKM